MKYYKDKSLSYATLLPLPNYVVSNINLHCLKKKSQGAKLTCRTVTQVQTLLPKAECL